MFRLRSHKNLRVFPLAAPFHQLPAGRADGGTLEVLLFSYSVGLDLVPRRVVTLNGETISRDGNLAVWAPKEIQGWTKACMNFGFLRARAKEIQGLKHALTWW